MDDRLTHLEHQVQLLETKVDALVGKAELANQLIKYVILPLIVILGGLVGVKLVLPQGG